jgi:hypothetical protein
MIETLQHTKETVPVTYKLTKDTHAKLVQLCEAEMRSQRQEIEFLIAAEFKSRFGTDNAQIVGVPV